MKENLASEPVAFTFFTAAAQPEIVDRVGSDI